MRRLLLTARARANLELPDGDAGTDARDIVDHLRQSLTVSLSQRHPDWDSEQVSAEVDRKLSHHYGPVVTFARERSQQPEGREWAKHLANNYKKVYNLHAGEDRGAPWWDRDRDVVWLLTAGRGRTRDL